MKTFLKRLLLKLARLPLLGWLVGLCITHFACLLPLRIVLENEHCIAFHHPLPGYDPHLLIMLKAQTQDISCVTTAQIQQIMFIAEAAVQKLGLIAPHIMVWTNGGRFQEVRQLHFHLFPSELDREDGLRDQNTIFIDGIRIRECIRAGSSAVDLLIVDAAENAIPSVLPQLICKYQLAARGYSVFLDISEQSKRRNRIYIRVG